MTTLITWSEYFLLEDGREDEKEEKSTDSKLGFCGVSKNSNNKKDDDEESTDVFDDTRKHHQQVCTKMSNPRIFIIWNRHGRFEHMRKNTQFEHEIFLIKMFFCIYLQLI